MKRALLLVSVMTTGCIMQPRGGTRVASATSPEPVIVWSNISASALPHGHVPSSAVGSPVGPSMPIAGLTIDTTKGPTRLSGVKDVEAAFAVVDLRDTADAQTAFCVGVAESRTTERGPRHGGVPAEAQQRALQFAIGLPQQEIAIRAERLTGAMPPQLHALTGWASASGMLMKSSETMVSLMPIARMAGVELFAFIDGVDGDRGAMANVIVRRPPLHRGQVHYASFTVSSPSEESTASCTHIRVGVPIEKGNGATAKVDVAVESERGARAMRVHVSTLWLKQEPAARLMARLSWATSDQDRLELSDVPRVQMSEATSTIDMSD